MSITRHKPCEDDVHAVLDVELSPDGARGHDQAAKFVPCKVSEQIGKYADLGESNDDWALEAEQHRACARVGAHV